MSDAPDEDSRVVTVESDDGRLVGVRVKNSWRSTLTTEELSGEIMAQLTGSVTGSFQEVVAQSIAELENLHMPTTRELMADPTPPTTSYLQNDVPLGRLIEIQEQLARISPVLLAPRTPDTAEPETFNYRGRVEIQHSGALPLGLAIDDSWASSAPVQSLSDGITEAFAEFYAAADAAPEPAAEPLLPEEKTLNSLIEELGLTDWNARG